MKLSNPVDLHRSMQLCCINRIRKLLVIILIILVILGYVSMENLHTFSPIQNYCKVVTSSVNTAQYKTRFNHVPRCSGQDYSNVTRFIAKLSVNI